MNYYADFDNCLGKVIDSLKKLLYKRHADIFERLDFYDDGIYQEPLLYTYINQQDPKWLDCIIYGYEKEKKEKIEVFSNSRGIIYIPRIGYFRTTACDRAIILETKGNEIQLMLDGKRLNYQYEPVLYAAHGIEIVKYQHPLLENVFTGQGTAPSDVIIEDVYKAHTGSFNKGLAIIEACNPAHFQVLLRVLKKVMLFTSERQNSFAVMTAHNMIFLNVNDWDDEIFFADHISHEGAHVNFFTLTYESKYELFKCHFNTPLENLLSGYGRHHSVYLCFHGLFTFVEITKCLGQCLEKHPENGAFSARQIHDINGRFIFHMQRYKTAIGLFESLDILKQDGLEWFSLFKEHYHRLEEKYNKLAPLYSLKGQPYDFNSKIFAEMNALHLPPGNMQSP